MLASPRGCRSRLLPAGRQVDVVFETDQIDAAQDHGPALGIHDLGAGAGPVAH
jgi:hypothetical protein